jgi:hypothetical protein
MTSPEVGCRVGASKRDPKGPNTEPEGGGLRSTRKWGMLDVQPIRAE